MIDARAIDLKLIRIGDSIKGLKDWKKARRAKKLPCAALDDAISLLEEYQKVIVNIKTRIN